MLGFSVAFNLLVAGEHQARMHNDLGVVMGREGRIQEAIGHFEKALRTAPEYDEAHYNLGVALEHAGRSQEAIKQYEQVLRITPGFIEARDALARLQTAGK